MPSSPEPTCGWRVSSRRRVPAVSTASIRRRIPARRRFVYNTRERNGMTESGGVHILVVDDEEGIREAFADLLADKGYEVSLAADGKQALEICHARQAPDLIFVDLMMPVMDGAEFIRVKDAD